MLPNGETYNIRTGITTLGFRNRPLGKRQPYSPNEVVEVEVESLPILWQLQAGSRIRIDIFSSDFPQYSIHSNYAGVWAMQQKTRKAHQTIYVGNNHESRIVIPLIQ